MNLVELTMPMIGLGILASFWISIGSFSTLVQFWPLKDGLSSIRFARVVWAVHSFLFCLYGFYNRMSILKPGMFPPVPLWLTLALWTLATFQIVYILIVYEVNKRV